MPHYPGHRDDAPPSTTDWAATNPNYNARTRLPRNTATATLPASNPYSIGRTRSYVDAYLNNVEAKGRQGYANALNTVPAYQSYVANGFKYQWNPTRQAFEVAGIAGPATTSSATGGGMGGVNTNFNKITNADQQQRQSLRTQYMMGLSPIQEGIRQARVGGTQSSDLLRSQMAQTAIGGFGGISGAAEQRVLDAARGQEGGFIRDRADLRSDYLAGLLGVDKKTADAISAEAIKRAAKLAAAEKDYLMKEAQRLVAQYEKLGEK
jgi:hypothetical protein